MGEIAGTYRVLQAAGARLGTQAPGGVSTLEPGQKLPPRVQEKQLQVGVKLLDGTVEAFSIEPKSDGQTLLNLVWRRLNLTECDYFGLEFQSAQGCWVWLEPVKPFGRQVPRPRTTVLRLAVKFFPPDPGQLQEEYTRYLFALQLKRDLLEQRLVCADTTAALLTSHLLQSEIGDYDEILDREHLKASEYLPSQGRCLHRILELHQQHMGQTPAESDFQLLEIARKLDLYGIRFHAASDKEGAKINLAVSHMGILVFQGTTKINTFNWSKVRKLSFKRKRFLIKLHPEVHGPYQDTLEFILGSRDESKSFWKLCVEHHTFFRLADQPKPKTKAVLFSRGSSFRYSGRTQKQLVDYIKDGGMRRTPYDRKHSAPHVSVRVLTADLPRQSISLTEGMRTPALPTPAGTSFSRLPASPSPPPGQPELPDAQAPHSNGAAEHNPDVPQPGPGLPTDSPLPSRSSQKSQLGLSPTSQGTLGSAEQGSFPLLSPVLSDAGAGMDNEEEPKHKRLPEDKAYFIAKELLATERTHLKDLEVITVWFRSALAKEETVPTTLMTLLFSNMDPVYEFHRAFLQEVEQRLALWEGPFDAHQRLGDILLRNMRQLQEFTSYFQKHDEVLTELEKATRCSKKLEAVYKEFELQKVCYLPLNAFLLKPSQRLVHLRLLLSRLCEHYPPGHHDYADCHSALQAVSEVTTALQHNLTRLENSQKLAELQRALVGIDNLAAPGREFIREGCLHKLTRKGLQQRMVFLFSDMLLYTSKGVPGSSHFRIRGLLPLHGMLLIVLDPPVEEVQSEGGPHCFTIYAAQRTLVLAASTRLEKDKWTRDLSTAIQAANSSSSNPALALPASTMRTSGPSSSSEVSEEQEAEVAAWSTQSPHRVNTTVHVCWYRNTSVSRADHSAAVENQLSGYLLRKFKNSSGWQKLWVVFTNFCLFFYKSHQDTCPLASLPLLGYSVSVPREADSIHKDYVFKLQFRSHVYFFRAESKYTFER
ncbi:FERM, ARHGEF and pleckstrin domain-containing protein 2 isoform X1 [Ochotona princeps]|uniref:FERM, ARHGEF and pleckstrin domain-containing protein 2 isoform X1 n=1 Tax=Ochotona princeps TaxID=9978 RepID=UPI002714AA4E|nr:FERM, ARHGEF and pleckstrin domain-containing protein 2 isoform X1 [Ochotona princeps]